MGNQSIQIQFWTGVRQLVPLKKEQHTLSCLAYTLQKDGLADHVSYQGQPNCSWALHLLWTWNRCKSYSLHVQHPSDLIWLHRNSADSLTFEGLQYPPFVLEGQSFRLQIHHRCEICLVCISSLCQGHSPLTCGSM
jgi:hypothetical protein